MIVKVFFFGYRIPLIDQTQLLELDVDDHGFVYGDPRTDRYHGFSGVLRLPTTKPDFAAVVTRGSVSLGRGRAAMKDRGIESMGARQLIDDIKKLSDLMGLAVGICNFDSVDIRL